MKTVKNDVTAERVRELFVYDSESGELVHRSYRGGTRMAGEPAGGVNNKGYIHVRIDGKKRLAHRLIWLYVHGKWPDYEIDNINGLRTDNRLENLRESDRSGNCRNTGMRKDNTSGVKGVSFTRDKYLAYIDLNKKHYHLGYFDTLDEATNAVNEARSKMHAEFSNYGF